MVFGFRLLLYLSMRDLIRSKNDRHDLIRDRDTDRIVNMIVTIL